MPERPPLLAREISREMTMFLRELRGTDVQISGEARNRLDKFEDELNRRGWALSPLGRYEIYRELFAEVSAGEQMQTLDDFLRRGVSTDSDYNLRFEQDPDVHTRRMRRDPEYRKHWHQLFGDDQGYATIEGNGGERESSAKEAGRIPSPSQIAGAVSTKPTGKNIGSQGYEGPGCVKVSAVAVGFVLLVGSVIYACSLQPESQQPGGPVKLPPPLPTPIPWQPPRR